MMKKVITGIFITLLTLSLVACGQPQIAVLVKSDKIRTTAPVVSGTDSATLVNNNSVFAFELYNHLNTGNANLFFSPLSISQALAMTYAGARGDTEKQMADTLIFNLSQDKLHPAFNWLDLELAKRGDSAQGKDEAGFRLNIVNAIWGQQGYNFLPGFLDTLAENYGAGMRMLDYVKQPEESRITINDWVSDQTEQRIKNLIPPGIINELTRLVLTNAIYFNAAWQHPFNNEMTQDEPFYLLGGTEITVPMMKQTETFGYTE